MSSVRIFLVLLMSFAFVDSATSDTDDFVVIEWRDLTVSVEPDDDAYVPDEDDRGSWLASMTCLDRAVERGMAGVASLILDGTDAGDLPQVSERARLLVAKFGESKRLAHGPADIVLAYVASFAADGATCDAVLNAVGYRVMPTDRAALAKPLSVALARGAADVAAALIRRGASVEDAAPDRGRHARAGGSRLSFWGTHSCDRPLCVAARSLANPACVGVLLLNGAAVRHDNKVPEYAASSDARGLSAATAAGGADGSHLPLDAADSSLANLERDISLGVVTVPDSSPTLRLARDARNVLARHTKGVPMVWRRENHAQHPPHFRAEVRHLLLLLYKGRCAHDDAPIARFQALGERGVQARIVERVVRHNAQAFVWPELPDALWSSSLAL